MFKAIGIALVVLAAGCGGDLCVDEQPGREWVHHSEAADTPTHVVCEWYLWDRADGRNHWVSCTIAGVSVCCRELSCLRLESDHE